jgi:hypothetical protein
MVNNYIFFQQELENPKNRFEPPYGTDENWINRKGVAVDLPVTPVVDEYVPLQIKENEKKDLMQEWENILKNGRGPDKIESVPLSQLRYETFKDSFNTLEIILLVLIFMTTFKILTTRALYSNSNKEKDTFENDAENLKNKEEQLEKITLLKELKRKFDDKEISFMEFEELCKNLFER